MEFHGVDNMKLHGVDNPSVMNVYLSTRFNIIKCSNGKQAPSVAIGVFNSLLKSKGQTMSLRASSTVPFIGCYSQKNLHQTNGTGL